MPILTLIPTEATTETRYRVDGGPDIIHHCPPTEGCAHPIAQATIGHHPGGYRIAVTAVLTLLGPVADPPDWTPLDEALLDARARILAALGAP